MTIFSFTKKNYVFGRKDSHVSNTEVSLIKEVLAATYVNKDEEPVLESFQDNKIYHVEGIESRPISLLLPNNHNDYIQSEDSDDSVLLIDDAPGISLLKAQSQQPQQSQPALKKPLIKTKSLPNSPAPVRILGEYISSKLGKNFKQHEELHQQLLLLQEQKQQQLQQQLGAFYDSKGILHFTFLVCCEEVDFSGKMTIKADCTVGDLKKLCLLSLKMNSINAINSGLYCMKYNNQANNREEDKYCELSVNSEYDDNNSLDSGITKNNSSNNKKTKNKRRNNSNNLLLMDNQVSLTKYFNSNENSSPISKFQLYLQQKVRSSRSSTTVGIYGPEKKEQSKFMNAISENNVEMVINFLNDGLDPNFIFHTGDTPLVTCIRLGHYDMMCILLNNGAHIEYVGLDGETPIHAICQFVQQQQQQYHQNQLQTGQHMLNMLLELGACINMTNAEGVTALYTCCSSNNAICAEVLLQHRCLISINNNRDSHSDSDGNYNNVKDQTGNTELHVACRFNNYQMVELLMQYLSNELIPDNQNSPKELLESAGTDVDINSRVDSSSIGQNDVIYVPQLPNILGNDYDNGGEHYYDTVGKRRRKKLSTSIGAGNRGEQHYYDSRRNSDVGGGCGNRSGSGIGNRSGSGNRNRSGSGNRNRSGSGSGSRGEHYYDSDLNRRSNGGRGNGFGGGHNFDNDFDIKDLRDCGGDDGNQNEAYYDSNRVNETKDNSNSRSNGNGGSGIGSGDEHYDSDRSGVYGNTGEQYYDFDHNNSSSNRNNNKNNNNSGCGSNSIITEKQNDESKPYLDSVDSDGNNNNINNSKNIKNNNMKPGKSNNETINRKSYRSSFRSNQKIIQSKLAEYLNICNSLGNTALHECCNSDAVQCVKVLLKYIEILNIEADLSIKNDEGFTAYQLAQSLGHNNIAKMIEINGGYTSYKNSRISRISGCSEYSSIGATSNVERFSCSVNFESDSESISSTLAPATASAEKGAIVFPYQANEDWELTVVPGQQVLELERGSDGWSNVLRIEDSKTGLVPTKYILKYMEAVPFVGCNPYDSVNCEKNNYKRNSKIETTNRLSCSSNNSKNRDDDISEEFYRACVDDVNKQSTSNATTTSPTGFSHNQQQQQQQLQSKISSFQYPDALPAPMRIFAPPPPPPRCYLHQQQKLI